MVVVQPVRSSSPSPTRAAASMPAAIEASPHVVELRQPAKERRFLHPRHVAGEDLRQMVVRVHEAGQHHLAAGIDLSVDPVAEGHGARTHVVDPVVFDEDPTVFEAGVRVVHGHEETRAVDEGAHGEGRS